MGMAWEVEGFIMTIPEDERKRITKEAMKEALKEWLDEKYAMFGRWALASLGALTLAAMLYLILWANGWNKFN